MYSQKTTKEDLSQHASGFNSQKMGKSVNESSCLQLSILFDS